jgi:hypothetical chaperone protein
MQKHFYGIDFGTSNSVLSIFDRSQNDVIKTYSVPSVLYFPFQQNLHESIQYLVGEKAIQHYIQEGMKGRFMKSIKNVLPISNFTETRIGNNLYNAADLVSFILTELKSYADLFVGYECDTVIMGRPVFFNDDDSNKDDLAQNRLKSAAEKSGFTTVKFQYEPISAAFAYEKTINRKEKVLVIDVGGGTTDFTYIELDPTKTGKTDRRKDILATGGITIGGDSFDASFMWEKGTPHFGRGVKYESMPGKMVDLPSSFFQNICSWQEMNFFNGPKVRNSLNQYYIYTRKHPLLKNLLTLIDFNLGYTVFQEIEKVKIELTTRENSTFHYSNHEIEINDSISKNEYNSIIKSDVERLSKAITKFLQTNSISTTEIDTVFLTGGTSLVEEIQELCRQLFTGISIQTGDHFLSVAKGLAHSEYLLEEEMDPSDNLS